MAKENIRHRGQGRKYSNLASDITSLNSTYVGFIQSSEDYQRMGKLSVWIPTINKDPDLGTFEVSYASPFAGASPIENGAQTSYGFWAVPPDIGNEVIVLFIDGDPNKGIWIGCLYQQFMNHMVPGIGTSNLVSGSTDPTGPSTEYNKSDQTTAASSMDPARPEYTALATGLKNQGLTSDNFRGQSTSSARRDESATVVGLLSPGGNQFVLDDNVDDSFIRMRTPGGTQVLINDTIGMVYIISKNGGSWAELSDEGIDMYSSGSISMRSGGDLNLHADSNINMYAGGINITSSGAMNLASGGTTNQLVGGSLNINSNSQMSIISDSSLVLSSTNDLGLDSGANLALRGCSELGITACGNISIKGSKLNLNSGDGPTPGTAVPATTKDISKLDDINPKSLGKTETSTIVSRLVTHEPFAGHPSVPSAPSSDSSSSSSTSSSSSSGSSTSVALVFPTSGKVSSVYGEQLPNGKKDGILISTRLNSTVITPEDGKVIWAGVGGKNTPYQDLGLSVCIEHKNGIKSIFGHLSNISVKPGSIVTKGSFIGRTGKLSSNTMNHLYIGMKKDGNTIDPAKIIPGLTKNKTIKAGSK